MSELLVLGLSHRTAPIETRERVALLDSRVDPFVTELTAHAEVHEAVVLSTCNRTEVYLVVGDPVAAESAALGMLAREAGIRPTELAGAIYSLRNCDVARHLFRVASGLDSMVLGETEIQGQVRRAFDRALAAGASGPMTNRLFRAAIATGKRVRTETAISDSRLSVSSIAVGFAREELGGLHGREVVILGTGETAELAARALATEGVRPVFVANRNRDRALALADRVGGRIQPVDELPELLEEADVLLAATSSPHAIVGADALELVMDARRLRPLLLIDLAVPRDVEPECGGVAGVTLFDVDDLEAVIARNRSGREAEATGGEAIVEEEIRRFAGWLGTLEVVPTIAQIRERGRAIVQDLLSDNAGRWEAASARDLERVETLANALVNRLLHEPTVRLKRGGGEAGRGHARLHVLRELFGLDDAGAGAAAAPEAQPARAAEVRPLRRP